MTTPRHTARPAPNLTDAEGWRYGVRFHDGSVRACWSGRTQRARAEAELTRLRYEYAPDRFNLVRQRIGEPWEEVQ